MVARASSSVTVHWTQEKSQVGSPRAMPSIPSGPAGLGSPIDNCTRVGLREGDQDCAAPKKPMCS